MISRLYFLLLLPLAACLFGAEPAPAPSTVVVFGDSIAHGGTLPPDQREQAWVRTVERESKGQLTVINEGKPGRPSDSVGEFRTVLTKHASFDLLVIALGTNDSRDVSGQCVPKAVANVRQMITAAREKHGEALAILLLGPPNIRKDALGPTKPIADQREANLKALGDAFSTLAKETHCDYLATFGSIPETSLSKDGVHPDAAGHAALAKVLLPKLLEDAKKGK
jgi:acyl-CoA thioesterase-1